MERFFVAKLVKMTILVTFYLLNNIAKQKEGGQLLALILNTVDLDAKNKNKFEMIYYKYRNMLFEYALKLVLNRADAEDVLQEAFIKIAKNIKTIRDTNEKETNSYLIMILKNTAYDFLRKKAKLQETDIDGIYEIPSDDFVESLVNRIEYQKAVEVIKGIPSPYCEVLYLHFVRDLSVKQTARLLDRKSETVKMQLIRGKRILKQRLLEVPYE